MKDLAWFSIPGRGTAPKRPLLFLTLAFGLGILTYGVLKPGLLFVFVVAWVIFLLAFAGLFAGWRVAGGLFLALAFLCGGLAAGLAWKSIKYDLLKYCNHYVTIEGRVVQAPQFRQESTDYVLQVERVGTGREAYHMGGKVLVKVRDKESRYGYGDRLRVKGLLLQPSSPGNPGEFNYQQYMARRGIVAMITAGPGEVKKLGSTGTGFTGLALLLRDKIVQVNRETLSPVHASMLNGMMFGLRGEIPRELQDAFSTAGLAHVLCVSGLHVGLVLGGLLFVLRLAGVSVSWIPIAATPALIFYAAMTGFGPAVLRATVMALLLLWAHRLGRENDWPTTLATAGLVILAVNPLQIYELGFQLSFAATWGILYLGPWLQGKLESLPFPAGIKPVLWVTVAAQLGTLPIIINSFNLVSFASLLANPLALPMAGIILFMGFFAGFCGMVIPMAAGAINAGTGILLGFYEWLVLWVREIPGACHYVAPWPWWGVLLWYLGLVIMVEWPSLRRLPFFSLNVTKFWVAALVSVAVLVIWWAGTKSHLLVVHFIDVGQGDSMLVQLPEGKNMLVDAGGWFGDFEGGPGVGDYVVVPYLKRLGINQLDAVLVTHFHEDHAGGVQAVLKSVEVRRLVIPPPGPEAASDPNVKAILAMAGKKKIPVCFANCGDELHLDSKVSLSFLGPPADQFEGSRSDYNNNSLVLFLDYGETEILLTGDIEEEMQSWLVERGYLRPVEVLKVPHHGSGYASATFFQQLRPVVAVISVGERNRFNLPSEKTIRQLLDLGARVYRTDRDGAVIVSSNGKKLVVKTGR